MLVAKPLMLQRSLLLFLLTQRIVHTTAQISITTVDDNDERINYEPSGSWQYGPSCSTCNAHPDPSQMYDQTWHDGSYYTELSDGAMNPNFLTVDFSFNGSAVYVYCALAAAYTTALTFIIDNEMAGDFYETNNTSEAYEYNILAYWTESLSQGFHTLTIINGQLGNGEIFRSLLLLDYIRFGEAETFTSTPVINSPRSTVSASVSSTSNTSSDDEDRTIIIIVASIGGAIILACAILIFVLWGNRPKSRGFSADGFDARESGMHENIALMNTPHPMTPARSEPVVGPASIGMQARIDLLEEPTWSGGVSSPLKSPLGKPNLTIIAEGVSRVSPRKPPAHAAFKALPKLPPISMMHVRRDSRISRFSGSQGSGGNKHSSSQSTTATNFISFSSDTSNKESRRESNMSTITYPNFLTISPTTDSSPSPARADSVKTIKLVPNRHPDFFDSGSATQVTRESDALSQAGSSRRSPRRFKSIGSSPVPPLPHNISES